MGEVLSLSVSALIPGDLMFFDASGNDGVIDHVGIYTGDNRMIHSSSSGDGVRYDNLTTGRGQFFVSRMVAARRVIGGSSSYASTQGPSVLGWLAKSFKGSKGSVQFDAPDWAPRPSTRSKHCSSASLTRIESAVRSQVPLLNQLRRDFFQKPGRLLHRIAAVALGHPNQRIA